MNGTEKPTIVIGFDGTECGTDSVALGLRLATATGDRAVIATVYPGEYPIGPGRVDAEWRAEVHRRAVEVSEQAKALAADSGVEVEAITVPAHSAARGLHELAESRSAEMVVVGSTARGALSGTMPGSTGERLLYGSSCPVVVAPRGAAERTGNPLASIVCAYVDTPDGGLALRAAAALSRRSGATLRLVTVAASTAEIVPWILGRDADTAYVERVRELSQEALDRALAGLPDGVQVTAEVLAGDVVETLAELTHPEVDLVVCGSRGYGPVRQVLLGGVSGRLVRRARVPVMVVPRSSESSGG